MQTGYAHLYPSCAQFSCIGRPYLGTGARRHTPVPKYGHPIERNSSSMSQLENASRALIEEHQLARLQLGLTRILRANRFYQEKLFRGQTSIIMDSLADLSRLPFTTKRDLVSAQEAHPLFCSNLICP